MQPSNRQKSMRVCRACTNVKDKQEKEYVAAWHLASNRGVTSSTPHHRQNPQSDMFSLFNLSAMQNCDYLFAEMPMTFFFIERFFPPNASGCYECPRQENNATATVLPFRRTGSKRSALTLWFWYNKALLSEHAFSLWGWGTGSGLYLLAGMGCNNYIYTWHFLKYKRWRNESDRKRRQEKRMWKIETEGVLSLITY